MNRKEILMVISILAIVLLLALIPVLARGIVSEGLLIGPEPYEAINGTGTAFSWMLGIIKSVLGLKAALTAAKAIPIASIILGGFMLFLILRLERSRIVSLLALTFFISSSAAISAMLRFGDYATHFLLASLGILIFTRKRAWPFSVIPLIIMCRSSPAFGLAILVGIFIFSAKRYLVRSLAVCLVSGLVGISVQGLVTVPGQKLLIADFGAITGVSIFTLLAAFGGMFVIWNRRTTMAGYYLFLAAVAAGFWLWPSEYALLLAAISSIFAAFAVERLLVMKWQFNLIKHLTLLTIACGVLFSLLVTLDTLTVSQPDSLMVQSWLSLSRMPKGNVLSLEEYGPWIRSFSGQEHSIQTSDAYEIFYAVELKKAKTVLAENNISYIWINDEMKNGRIWHQPEEGLLFLLRNNETFNKVYQHAGIEIWEVANLSLS
ncbi:MAG: hypothetical protein KJ709_08805 [Nanoarchaeota archaeon]|nr:hypothetical protein [Nanoarchaeota archaeon]